MKKKLILIGAGGHANSVLEIIEENKKYQILGFLDNKKKNIFCGYKILGKDNLLKKYSKNCSAFISIGQIKNYKIRTNIFNKLILLNYDLPSFTAKSSFLSKNSSIGSGTILMRNVIVNANSSIADNCIINNNALIEHDVIISSNCHISTGVIINGNVKINKNSFIGSGSIIKEGVKIGKSCIIGAGKVIKKDIISGSKVY